MLSYVWPIALVVVSNTVYQICAKSVPAELDPFAALTVTYLIGAAASAVLYFALNMGGNLLHEIAGVNWSSIVLGIVIVGLETGCIFAYKAGWPVSSMQIAQSAILAVMLILVGFFLYKEEISASKLLGIAICLVGLYFVNR